MPSALPTANVNWADVERLYREGVLSNKKIGLEFGVTEGAIRKRAKAGGWIKGEPTAVREEAIRQANERMARVPKPKGPAPEMDHAAPALIEPSQERVQAIASPIADVLIYHRGQASRLRSIVMKLAHELEEASDTLPEIEGALEEYFLTKAAGNPLMAAVYRQQLQQALHAVGLGSRSKIAVNLVTAFKGLVEAERKSWNLDDDKDDRRGYEDVLMELHEKTKAMQRPEPVVLDHEQQAA